METYTPSFCDRFDGEPFQAQFMVLKPDINFQCQLYILSMEVKYEKSECFIISNDAKVVALYTLA